MWLNAAKQSGKNASVLVCDGQKKTFTKSIKSISQISINLCIWTSHLLPAAPVSHNTSLQITEIQPSQRELHEEWPPGCGSHQTQTLFTLSHRQSIIWLPLARQLLIPPGPLQPEPEPRRIQTRRRHTGSYNFIQRVHHSHPRPQAWGRFHWWAIRKPCQVQRAEKHAADMC